MNKGLRLTERWMQLALWLVALLFASFLIGLGGKVVANLADVEPVPTAESLIDPVKLKPVKEKIDAAEQVYGEAASLEQQAEHARQVAASNTSSAREAFDNWIATRQATLRPDQDSELIARTRDLDALIEAQHKATAALQAQKKIMLNAEQAKGRAYDTYNVLLKAAHEQADEIEVRAARKVFYYRVGATLPLLAIAAVLFRYKRKGKYWPFTWGFIFFALFAFFVELVPYLPDYGGYLRYGVGILLTVAGGRYAIRWLQGWLERQRAVEALPDAQRRTSMRYDVAVQRIGKSVCPSCERPTNFKDEQIRHCPHCGIGLFDRCPACSSRKNAFARFCFSCGTPASASLAD